MDQVSLSCSTCGRKVFIFHICQLWALYFINVSVKNKIQIIFQQQQLLEIVCLIKLKFEIKFSLILSL